MTDYSPLVKTEQEPECKANPPLKISSVGAEIKKNSSQMPDGSALLTDTGNNSSLKSQGINYIIHAVPRHRNSCASDEEFIEIAVKAAQNSIILADREGIDKLAICFIGGEIYRGSCDPTKLAEGIIRGSINQLAECQKLGGIMLVDWKDSPQHYFLEKVRQLENSELFGNNTFFEEDNHFIGELKKYKGRGLEVRVGDICDKKLHKAEAIVNSENAGMNWGGGISGAIKSALGTEAGSVDQQRKGLMKEFNSLINGQQPINNKEKISSLFRFVGRGSSIADSEGNYTSFFFPHDVKPGETVKKSIQIRNNHPTLVKHGSQQFWKIPENQNIYKVVKLTWYKAEEDKKLFEKGDFIEIEEIKDNNQPPVQNNDNNHNQNPPTKNDNDQSEDNDKNDDNGQNQNNDNGDGSNDNNPDIKKNKNSPPSPKIPDSVKEYFQKNSVRAVELDGENWIITYKNKNEKKSFQRTDIPELKDLQNYLKSRGIKILTDEELENSSSTNPSTSKDNETKYWPWILGAGGILVVGIIVWAVCKNRKNK